MLLRRSIFSTVTAVAPVSLVLLAAGCGGASGPDIAECISSWNANVPTNQNFRDNQFGVIGVSLDSPRRCLFSYRDPKGKIHEFERRDAGFKRIAFDPHQKILAKSATQVSVDSTGRLTKVGHAKPSD